METFYSISRGLASGAPFKLNQQGFDLTGIKLSDSERKTVCESLTHENILTLTIKSKEECKMVGDIIQMHPALNTIRFTFDTDNSDGVDYLAERLKHSKVSEVYFTRFVKMDGQKVDLSSALEALKYVKLLRDVHISLDMSTKEGEHFAEIFENQDLQKLNWNHSSAIQAPISDNACRRLCAAIATHSSLNNVSLRDIPPVGYAALGAALKTNTSLLKLWVIPRTISPEDATHLCEGLKSNSTLHEIRFIRIPDDCSRILFETLADNGIKVSKILFLGLKISLSAAAALSNSLKTNTKLVSLDLTDDNLDGEKTRLLCQGLQHNKTIQTLTLDANEIELDGAKAIGELLKCTMALKKLDVSNCRLGAEHMRVLADGLKVNKTLVELIVKENLLDAIGCGYICEALITNHALKRLDLELFNTTVGLEGMTAIKNMLTVNTTLRNLNASCFNEPEELEQLQEALKINQGLTSLTAHASDYTGHEWVNKDGFFQCMRDNYTLTTIKLDVESTDIYHVIQRNQKLHSEMKYKIAILSHNIARSQTATSLLPREMWILILKSVTYPGLDFDDLVDRAFSF